MPTQNYRNIILCVRVDSDDDVEEFIEFPVLPLSRAIRGMNGGCIGLRGSSKQT